MRSSTEAAVLAMLHAGQLSVGHARALLAIEDARVATTLAPREVREIVHVPVDAEGPIERHGALIKLI